MLTVYEREVNGLVLYGKVLPVHEAYKSGHLQVLGWEGLWGTLGMAIIGMPLAWFLPGSDIGQMNYHSISFHLSCILGLCAV